MERTTRIAHASDLHVLDLNGVHWSRYLNKRLTGIVSLALNRKAAHPVQLAEQLVQDLLRQDVEHICITGDLTNLALDSEFKKAKEVLQPLLARGEVSMVPGNHDIYTRGSERDKRFESYFGEHLWPSTDARTYPWHKRVRSVQLVGFCSAVPRAPLMATGVVSDAQLDKLDALSRLHCFQEHFVIALIHHNLHSRAPRKNAMHGLDNRDQVLERCRDAGVNLLLHGHTHVAHRFDYDGMAVVGCGSSTWSSDHEDHRARYNIYTVTEGRLVAIERRMFDPTTHCFVAAGNLEVGGVTA